MEKDASGEGKVDGFSPEVSSIKKYIDNDNNPFKENGHNFNMVIQTITDRAERRFKI